MPAHDPLDPTPDLAAIEERCWRLWDEAGVYRFDAGAGGEIFSVDTPPPYASAAHLHVGHAMSYAQAEMLVRYHRMRGRRVLYPMGFDDNGLPTERYVERKYGIGKQEVSRAALRRLCLAETEAVADRYRRAWRALGLSVDWSFRYSTIDDHCRRTAQRSFVELLAAGRIYHASEPVHWDRELQTALAQADLETVERQAWLHNIAFTGPEGRRLAISTTRPELLAACVALYCHPEDDRYRQLVGAEAVAPLSGHAVEIRADTDVDPTFGTGLLMVCTYGDADDVRRWKRDQLPLRTCIDEHGRLTGRAGPHRGLLAEEARARIVDDLEREGALLGRRRVTQRVAVSERSGAVVEYLVRPQWFVRVLDLREELLERAAAVALHPPWMRQRLEDWIRGLDQDWNVSRQRFYGVPFPVWFCDRCQNPLVADVASLPVDPMEDPPPADRCPRCGSTDLYGDPDVMDTWMTSSLTPQILANWAGTPGRPTLGAWPLSLRPQAHDIIRTWLFYTLVKAHLHNGSVPWRHVMISGWGLDEQGRRISKRDLDPARPVGTYNRYDPEDVIARHGADALRHWAARSSLGQDVRYRERDVRAGRKVVIKLWNLARFCDANAGGRLTAEAIPVADRPPEDRWLLHAAGEATGVATAALDRFDHATARAAIDGLLWTFADDWLEITKDRFWTPSRYAGAARLSAASTMRESLRTLLGLYAPFLPFVTEELYQRLYRGHEEAAPSIHATAWPRPDSMPGPVPEMTAVLAVLHAVRAVRTERRLPQTAELARVVVDAGDRPDLHASLSGMRPTLQAAARAADVGFGNATADTAVEGLRIAVEP